MVVWFSFCTLKKMTLDHFFSKVYFCALKEVLEIVADCKKYLFKMETCQLFHHSNVIISYDMTQIVW